MSKRGRRKNARGGRPASTRALARADGGGLVRLDVRTARAIVDASGQTKAPERGRRTPRADSSRIHRRSFFDLELADITSILRRMEDGDTRDGVDLWCRMLKVDIHLRSVWESRGAPVYAAPHEVLASKPVTDGSTRLADACREVIDGYDNLESVNAALLDAGGVGFAVGEIEWVRSTLLGVPAWVPHRVTPVHSRRFRWSDHFELGLWDDGLAVSRLRAAGWHVDELTARGAKLAALPRGKYLVHTPIGIHDYPTAAGLVHPFSRWWWVKQVATKYWLHGAEIAANPRIIGKISQLAHGAITLEEFFSDLEDLAADGIMVLREGTSVDITDSKAAISADVWDKLVRRADAAITKGALGSTLNVEIDSAGGNRAAAESQGDSTILPRQHLDQAQLWSSWRRGVFRYIRDFNPHLFDATTPLPSARSVLIAETGTVDELAVSTGAVRVDQVLQSRGLPTIGGERGNAFVPAERAGLLPSVTSGEPEAKAAKPAAAAASAKPTAADQASGTGLDAGAEDDVQATAYNGAQQLAFDAIVQAVVTGEKPRGLAVEQLVTLFQIERTRAQQIVDSIPIDFVAQSTIAKAAPGTRPEAQPASTP